MTENQTRRGKGRGALILALWLALAPLVGACSVIASASNGTISIPTAGATAPALKLAPSATPTPLTRNRSSRIDCPTTYRANLDLDLALLQLVNLTPDSNYAELTDEASPMYLDFAQLHADLNTLAALPDPADAVELADGKPSEALAYVRQLVDIAERNVQGQPFQDSNAAGQKVIGLDSRWLKERSPLGRAIDRACPGFILTAAAQTANPPTPQPPETPNP